MAISGNVSNQNYPFGERARAATSALVYTGKLAADGAVWPMGLVVVKVDAAANWAPLDDEPDEGALLGVLDETVNTADSNAALIVQFGAVKAVSLKIGVAAPVAAGADIIFALAQQKIFAV